MTSFQYSPKCAMSLSKGHPFITDKILGPSCVRFRDRFHCNNYACILMIDLGVFMHIVTVEFACMHVLDYKVRGSTLA